MASESGAAEGGFRARAGALTLLYIASPMERRLLLALLAEATTGVEVMDDDDFPDPDDPVPLEVIADPYLVEPADPNADPDAPIEWDTALKASASGEALLFVGSVLERWLNICPDGPLELGAEAGVALSALLGGWSSAVMHALAAKPLTIAETAEAVALLDADLVEERLIEMEGAGLAKVAGERDGDELFEVTDWLRMAIAPLAAAARQELRYPIGDTAPVAALDVEAAFLLTLPLVELPEEVSGSCSLAVELEEGVTGSPSGVTVRVERGRVTSCEVGLDEDADVWASALAADWLDTVIEPDVRNVRAGGDQRLGATLLDALHEALFESRGS